MFSGEAIFALVLMVIVALVFLVLPILCLICNIMENRCKKLCNERDCTGKCTKRLWLVILRNYIPLVLIGTVIATFIGICINWNLFYVWGIAAAALFVPIVVGVVSYLSIILIKKGVVFIFSNTNKFADKVESFLDNMETKENDNV